MNIINFIYNSIRYRKLLSKMDPVFPGVFQIFSFVYELNKHMLHSLESYDFMSLDEKKQQEAMLNIVAIKEYQHEYLDFISNESPTKEDVVILLAYIGDIILYIYGGDDEQ